MARSVDEINEIRKEYSDIDIDTYFEPMPITEDQKEERKKTAEDLWWVLLLLFALIRESIESGDLDYAFIYDTFRDSYADVVSKYAETDDYINEYVNQFTQRTLDTTWDNLDVTNPDSYWTSNKRSIEIAVNEANTIHNYKELQNAIEEGKTHKIWKAELTKATRKDHEEMNGKKIPIKDYFQFPDCKMLMPHDEVNGTAKQTVNCRCSLRFEGKDYYEENYGVRREEKDSLIRPKGIFEKEPNFKNQNNEEGIGRWLYDNFGGDIVLREDRNIDNQLNPDYLWNGKLWDLKSPTSPHISTVRKRVKHGIEQIALNPGGVIIDLSNSILGEEDILKIIKDMESGSITINAGTKFIVKKGEEFSIWRKI